MADKHDEALLAAMAALHTSERYSDMVISCGGRDFRVHRAVVCSQSDLLAREIQSSFKESAGVIEHNHFGPEAIQRMIQYLYTRSYDVPLVKVIREPTPSASSHLEDTIEDILSSAVHRLRSVNAALESSSAADQTPRRQHDADSDSLTLNEVLTLHAEMGAVGNYFHIDSLKLKAAENFKSAFEMHPWEKRGFLALIDRVYAVPKSEDRGMRDVLLDAAQKHAMALSQEPDFVAMIDGSPHLGEFCAAFTRAIIEASILDAEGRKVTQETLEGRVAELQAELIQEKLDKQQAQENHEKVTSILHNMSVCRHVVCPTPIAVSVERYGGDMVVRCKKCDTKHS